VTTPSLPLHDENFERFAAALAGQYELECEIGRGGMGVVYRARDVRLDRVVAIKTLPPHLAGDPVVRERFLREARTAGSLSDQHIVPIYRADELGGHVFFVMGYVDGESLAQRIAQRKRLDPREVVRELRDVAGALAHAHRRGIVHRDVKAENILIDAFSGSAMVTDFGIARLAEAAPLTATGQVLGTVYYLSPEQVSGEAVDARSDIYSLGVVAFFALAGRFPFDAELASAVLIAHVTKTAPPLHSIAPHTPHVLSDLVDRCLQKDPSARPQTCDEIVRALINMTDTVDREATISEAAVPEQKAQLVSDTEANQILGRAADLQAYTGLQQRPAAPVVPPRDSRRDAERTSGYSPANLRDAAVEAGIPARYVDRALAEHGIGEGNSLVPVTVDDRSAKPNKFIGGRTMLEFEVVVDGEVSSDDYDILLETIRRHIGEPGTVGSVGRSFTWQTGGERSRRPLIVTFFPRGGKTTIRVTERSGRAAGGLFGGLLGGWGGGSTGIWIGIGASQHNPALGLALAVANMLTAYTVARMVFARQSNSRQKSLRALAEELGAQARALIDADRKKLGAGR
jgi:serine/threonine-protein kinase